jgi:Rad3-related DNA helicase
VTWAPIDIEELKDIGRKQSFCPYYQQTSRIEEAQLVFMPYNYLLDSSIRQSFKFEI